MNQLNRTYLLIAVIVVLSFHSNAQLRKRLYIANDDHTDYMWSGNVAQYDSAFVKMLDYHLERIEATKTNPDNYQDRFNCDGSYWLKTYQKYRSVEKFNKLVEAIRSGHISAPLNTVVSTFGAQPAEAVIRGMYYAGQLERQYQLKFNLAGAMENNTLPLGLASLWSGSGAKYSWKGVGGYGSQLSQESMKHRKYQLYNYKGLDSSGVLMKWYAVNASLGGYAECRIFTKDKNADSLKMMMGIVDKLDSFCDTIAPNSTYPYLVAGAFGYGHDDLQTFVSEPFIKLAANETTVKRTVRVSNEEDFFKDVQKTYPQLPSQSVSYGNEWDLLAASMNETTAEVKRATEKLRVAEAMASIVALKDPYFSKNLIQARDKAWDAFGLYWEHNWTADGPVGNKNRGLWQIGIKNDIKNYVDSLYALSCNTLGGQLKKGKNERFFVFNAMGWVRDDVADIPFHGKYPAMVVDVEKNQEVPSQLIEKNGQPFLRIEALHIPSVGYKVYEIQRTNYHAEKNLFLVDHNTISNRFYKLRLNRSGAITELYDKTAKKNWVKRIDGKYINDLGGDDVGQVVGVENAGPVSITLKAISQSPVAHTVRVTLYRNLKRIDIESSIDTNFKDNKFWAFSFNMNHPVTHHEEVGAVLTVKKITNGGQYADQNARYDWQTFNHFADMSDDKYGITLSNLDCSFFKLGKSTVDSLWDTSSQLTALAGGQIDIKKEDKGVLGIHNQLGQNHFHYHFAIITHQGKFDAATAMKRSLEHQNPMAVGMVQGKADLQNKLHFSLLSINDPNVILWSLKPAEEGISNGLIARFWNLNNHPVQSMIKLYKPVSDAWKTTHIETNIKRLEVVKGCLSAEFKQQQLNTYRLNSGK